MAKEMMKNKPILHAEIGTIGDFINIIPAMIDIAKQHEGLNVFINPEIQTIFDLIPSQYNIVKTEQNKPYDIKFDVSQAFNFAISNNLHMSQAYHIFAGLPTPAKPIRAELDVPEIEVPVYDYCIAPNSRCLPLDQRWQPHKWKELIDKMPDKSFCLFGNSRYDDPNYIQGNNLVREFDRPFSEVSNIMKKSRKGLISVITGLSHLAYVLNVKNYLLDWQSPYMIWGINPDANRITYPVSDIKVSDVIHFIGGI